jgi:transcriptional regulator with XRE-family HTH domain
VANPWDVHLEALGEYIRAQRKLANLSLRQLADLAGVSNPYISQIERGLHEPSVHVLQSIARGLNLSAETLLEHAGLMGDEPRDGDGIATPPVSTEVAIRIDPDLTDEQKDALLAVYRSYRSQNVASTDTSDSA